MSELPPQPSAPALAAANLPDGALPEVEEHLPADSVPIEPVDSASTPPTAAGAESATISDTKDVDMLDLPADQTAQPTATAPAAATANMPANASLAASTSTTNAPSPVPARVSTPMRNTNANGDTERTGSRAASAHPDPGFNMPAEAPVHGAPVRQYINTKITGVLLEGMKQVAKEQPKDPLRMLGEFLLARSKELEETTS